MCATQTGQLQSSQYTLGFRVLLQSMREVLNYAG